MIGCRWFLACDNPADGVLPHPVLGDTPCCQRCADTVGETLIPLSDTQLIERELSRIGTRPEGN